MCPVIGTAPAPLVVVHIKMTTSGADPHVATAHVVMDTVIEALPDEGTMKTEADMIALLLELEGLLTIIRHPHVVATTNRIVGIILHPLTPI